MSDGQTDTHYYVVILIMLFHSVRASCTYARIYAYFRFAHIRAYAYSPTQLTRT